MSSEIAIDVEGLGKRYRVGNGRRNDTLRDVLSAGFRSMLRRDPSSGSGREFWALRDVGFSIRHGESVGVIGLNGAGKSTLLKLLSRITEPTEGRALISGRISALLEVGTGFHGELTGRENIYLYSAILGMRRDEVARKFDAIVDFAGLENFVDTPVKRYSSGMYVRLAFSVAAHLQPDILLLDEVLSVGDMPFQKKCMDFAARLQSSNATILFVSHNMFSIKSMCSRALYLRRGRICFDGPTEDAIGMYEKDCRLGVLKAEDAAEDWPIVFTDVSITDEKGLPRTVFDYGERMRLRLQWDAREAITDPGIIVAFIRSDGVACCNYSSEADGFRLGRLEGEDMLELLTPPLKLVAELYTVHVLVRERGFQKLLCLQIGGTFHVRHDLFDAHFGVFHEPSSWTRWREDIVRPAAPDLQLVSSDTNEAW